MSAPPSWIHCHTLYACFADLSRGFWKKLTAFLCFVEEREGNPSKSGSRNARSTEHSNTDSSIESVARDPIRKYLKKAVGNLLTVKKPLISIDFFDNSRFQRAFSNRFFGKRQEKILHDLLRIAKKSFRMQLKFRKKILQILQKALAILGRMVYNVTHRVRRIPPSPHGHPLRVRFWYIKEINLCLTLMRLSTK